MIMVFLKPFLPRVGLCSPTLVRNGFTNEVIEPAGGGNTKSLTRQDQLFPILAMELFGGQLFQIRKQ
jgi:hypothetical protein